MKFPLIIFYINNCIKKLKTNTSVLLSKVLRLYTRIVTEFSALHLANILGFVIRHIEEEVVFHRSNIIGVGFSGSSTRKPKEFTSSINQTR